jgi:ornithine cyclodeaminase/alanine dehydrogenase-like protein (mu-crystallin family)
MTSKTIRFLSADDIAKTLPMPEAIEVMRDAFVQLSSGDARVPVRQRIDIEEKGNAALFMPVYYPKTNHIGLKVVTIFPQNNKKGLPFIHAQMMVFDAGDGRPIAIIDGELLTAIRTGAASGLATDLLACKEARIAAIIGCGVQGKKQLEGICCVRSLNRILLLDRDAQVAERFAEEMRAKLNIDIEVITSGSRLKEADIICTATTSQTPVFDDEDIQAGCHINGVGSYKPVMQEIPSAVLVRSKLIVDSREACLAEAGDISTPIKQGLISKNHLYAELGEIISGKKEARSSNAEITVFKSVGNAVQDIAAAARALENAEKQGLGSIVKL